MKKIRVFGLFMTFLLVGVLGYAQIAADAVKGSGTATVGQGTSASNRICSIIRGKVHFS